MRRPNRDNSLNAIRILGAQQRHDKSTHRVSDNHSLGNLELIQHSDYILRNGLNGDGLTGVFGACGAVGVEGDAAVFRCEVGNHRVVEVLGGAKAVDEGEGEAVRGGAAGVGVGVVEFVIVDFDEGHFGGCVV